MTNAVEIIEAVGQLGAVAAISSIVSVAVTQWFNLKHTDKGVEQEILREARIYSRSRLDAFREFELSNIMELQELLWPMQEQASLVERVRSGLDERATGEDPIRKLPLTIIEHSRMNSRSVVLLARIRDEELRRLERVALELG